LQSNNELAQLKTFSLKPRILIPLTLALSILLGTFIYNVHQTHQIKISNIVHKRLRLLKRLFEKQLDSDSEHMYATVNALSLNQPIQAAWLAKDRKLLQELALPMLTELRGKYQITHLYFHQTDRVSFLRVHKPELHGDLIDRVTLLEAEKTGRYFSGCELGPLGTYTLRVVYPWRINSQLVGYIEIGKEIAMVVSKLRAVLSNEFYISIYKQFIDREQWERGMKMLGRESSWDQLDESVIVYHTLPIVPRVFQDYLSAGQHQYWKVEPDLKLQLNHQAYRVAVIPLFDAGNQDVGDLVMLYNVTDLETSSRKSILIAGIVCVFVGLALFILFSAILGKTEKKLVISRHELIKARNELEEKVKQRTVALEETNKELQIKIEQHKKAEEQQRLQGEIATNMSEGIFLIRVSDGSIVYTNPKIEKVFGYDHNELIGKPVSILNAPTEKDPEETANEITKSLKEKGVWQGDVYNIKKDGTPFWGYASASIFNHSQYGEVFVSVYQDITEQKETEKTLKRSQEKLRNLSTHLQSVAETERINIAREIHDELGQLLTAVKIDLTWLMNELSDGKKPLVKKIKTTLSNIDSGIQTVKKISSDLRPNLLDRFGVIPALKRHAKEFQTRMGIKCEITFNTDHLTLDKDHATAIFRIFQESLTNIARHADASMIKASLEKEDSKLYLKIKDNGKGITANEIASTTSFGIMGMRERALFIGGTLEINGVAGKGTTIIVTVPSPGKVSS